MPIFWRCRIRFGQFAKCHEETAPARLRRGIPPPDPFVRIMFGDLKSGHASVSQETLKMFRCKIEFLAFSAFAVPARSAADNQMPDAIFIKFRQFVDSHRM
jgi:hypothetical protein